MAACVQREIHKKKLLLSCLLATYLAGLFIPAAYAEERTHKVEAAFLNNFFNYITWPGLKDPESLQDATICIQSKDPIRPYLTYLQRRSQERKLIIRALEQVTEEEITGCHILFLRRVDRYAQDLLDASLAKGVLLVSEDPSLQGSIALTREGDRFAMEINYTALKRADFQVSSRLLNLAREVN